MPLRHRNGLLLLAMGVAGCAAPDQPTAIARRRQAVEGGEIDEVHSAVFRVATRTQGFNGLCSASLIAPNLLLTARHCVAETAERAVDCTIDEFGRTLSTGELLFSNAVTPELGSRWFSPQQVLVREESTFCGNDMALVILEEVVPDTVAAAMSPRLTSISVGELYDAVGYGGSDASADDAEYGTRRFRTGLSVSCVGKSCGEGVSDGEFGGDEGVCRGDSGGPAVDGEGRAMGALSRGGEECVSPVYASAPDFRDWLIETAALAASLGDYPRPVWAGGPAPTSGDSATSGADAGPARSNEPGAAPSEPLRAEGCAASTPNAGGAELFGLLLGLLSWRRRRAPCL